MLMTLDRQSSVDSTRRGARDPAGAVPHAIGACHERHAQTDSQTEDRQVDIRHSTQKVGRTSNELTDLHLAIAIVRPELIRVRKIVAGNARTKMSCWHVLDILTDTYGKENQTIR